MRYKHIMAVFFASLPIAVIARSLQMLRGVDRTTGFITRDKTSLIITAAVMLIAVIISVCALTVKRAPLKSPKVRKPLGLGALIAAAAMALDALSVLISGGLGEIPKIVVAIAGVAVAAFFACYAAKAVKKYHLPKLLYALPCVYFAIRLVTSFIGISGRALISTDSFMILALSATTLFFLEFAKIANGYDKEKSYKKIMLCGILSVYFNAVFSIPEMLVLLSDIKAVEHQSSFAMVAAMLMGVFVSMYLLAHFSNKNLKDHRYRDKKKKSTTTYMKLDKEVQEFYYGKE